MASLKEQFAKKKQHKQQKHPKKPEIFNLSLEYYAQGHFHRAIETVTQSIELNPNIAEAYNLRGVYYRALKKYELALADCNTAIKLSPYYSEVYCNRGSYYFELKNYELALADYNKVIELNPNDFIAYSNRGSCHRLLKNYELSLADCNKAIELNSNFAEACYSRGNCYYDLKEYDLSLADYNKAIELNPNYFIAYSNRGSCHRQLKNYELALADCNKAIELNINFSEAYNNRGNCYCDLKEYNLALADYNKAIELNPNYAEAYCNRGKFYIDLEKYDLACTDYNKSIQLNPNFAGAYFNRGRCYHDLKNYDLALTDYDKAIQLNPNWEDAYFNRAILYGLNLNNYDLFLADLDKSINYCEDIEEKNKRFILASHIYSDIKEYDKARNYIEQAFEKADSKELQHKKIYLQNIDKAQELDIKNKQLELEIQQKEAVEKRMQKLVEQFTHSLGNVIFPDTIYQVAERLKNLPECRRDTLLLHEAYHAEIIIKLQAELLRQRYSNTNPEKFRLMIRNCRRNANAGDKTKTIEAILNYAVSRVTARFLNQHYAGLETIRNKILTQTNTDLNQLKQKFEDDILLHGDSSNPLKCVEWVNKKLRPIQITQISPLWKKVFILSDSYAEALLFGYFSEILFNAFKYADHENQEFLTLSFAEETINEDIYLSCNWSNPTTNQKLSGLGTNQGLEAIAEDLKQLNSTEKPEQSLLICQQDNQFQVTLFFKKDLLIDDSNQLKIKRPVNRVEQA